MPNGTDGPTRPSTMTAAQARVFVRLMRAAEAGDGDGDAACRLGDLYREARGGVSYSPKAAHRWYARSALAGDRNGQNNLGACHEHGVGCVQSYAKAVKWYRRSAAQGLGTASMNLGYCHLRGHGVPANRGEAVRLFRLAVTQGESRAADELERLGEPIVAAAADVRAVHHGRVRFVTETPGLGVHLGLVGIEAPVDRRVDE